MYDWVSICTLFTDYIIASGFFFNNFRFNPLTSVWENLKGVDVTSKPDLRLFTEKSNGPALCVIEVIVTN